MRQISSRLIQESASRDASGEFPDVTAVLGLLYERLQPVVGTGGFRALLRRALLGLGDRHGDLTAVADAEDLEGMAERIRGVQGNGTAEPGRLAADMADAVVGTLERMLGPELTERLIIAGEGPGRPR